MNILYITCGSGSDPTVGGSLARTLEIAQRIGKGYRVFFLTTTAGAVAIRSNIPLAQIFRIPTFVAEYNNDKHYFLKQILSYLMVVVCCPFFLFILPRCNLIYTDSDGLWDIIPALWYRIRFSRARWVAMNHHLITVRKDSATAFVFSMINIILQRTAYVCIACFSNVIFTLDTPSGEAIKNYFKTLRIKKQFFSVQNGVNIRAIEEVLGGEKKYDACFFGALRPSKGLYDIVPLWKEVCSKDSDAVLVVVGGMLDIYRRALIQEIQANGLSRNIILKDYVPQRYGVFRLLKESRIFISPSQEEGWGIAVMECLACGLPGVVWELPSYQKILVGGVLKVSLGKHSEFAQKVIELLSDAQLYTKLQKEALPSVRMYDWDIVAKKELHYFTEITQA